MNAFSPSPASSKLSRLAVAEMILLVHEPDDVTSESAFPIDFQIAWNAFKAKSVRVGRERTSKGFKPPPQSPSMIPRTIHVRESLQQVGHRQILVRVLISLIFSFLLFFHQGFKLRCGSLMGALRLLAGRFLCVCVSGPFHPSQTCLVK